MSNKVIVIVLGLLTVLAAQGGPGGYDEPEVLSAAAAVSAELRSGPHHKVEERITNDGYLNTYTIVSDFGTFEARGEDLLRARVQEVAALATLSEVTKSEAFTKAFAEAAIRPVEAVGKVVQDPVGTVKGLPSGVSRYFKRTARRVKKTAEKVDEQLSEDEQEEAAGGEGEEVEAESQTDKAKRKATDASKSYLGVNRSMREWAQQLGVDPYSSNEVLQKELGRVASAASVASFGVRKMTPSIDVVDYLGDVNDMVWEMNPADLEVLNLKRLKEMGVDKESSEALLANAAYSPSRLSGLVTALHGIRIPIGRAGLVERAAAAESEEEAFFFQRSAEILRVYHAEVSPIRDIATGDVWGGGITAAGTFVMPLAVDHLTWTEELATLTAAAAGRYRELDGVERLALIVGGSVSPRAREELTALGWKVQEGARGRWLDR